MQNNNVFNYRFLRTAVGLVALFLAFYSWIVANLLYSTGVPTSISITYHLGVRDVFVGCLFLVGGFFIAYRGVDDKNRADRLKVQSFWSNVGGVCAILVALFPTQCEINKEDGVLCSDELTANEAVVECTRGVADIIDKVTGLEMPGWLIQVLHTGAAVILIGVLLAFCIMFYQPDDDRKVWLRNVQNSLLIGFFTAIVWALSEYVFSITVGELWHILSMIITTTVLIVFVWHIHRAHEDNPEDKYVLRQKIYWICATVMVAAVFWAILDALLLWLAGDKWIDNGKPMFWVELLCLVSFGVSWLVAGKNMKCIATKEELSDSTL